VAAGPHVTPSRRIKSFAGVLTASASSSTFQSPLKAREPKLQVQRLSLFTKLPRGFEAAQNWLQTNCATAEPSGLRGGQDVLDSNQCSNTCTIDGAFERKLYGRAEAGFFWRLHAS